MLRHSETNPELGLSIGLDFQINMYAVSGLKVDSLRLFHEGYKPYKVNFNRFSFRLNLFIVYLREFEV